MTDSTGSDYITQLPGELNIDMVCDNDLVFTIDWGFDVSAYTFEANIIPKDCTDDTDEISIAVDTSRAATGIIELTITETSIDDLVPSINSWYLNWTTPSPDNYIRTILAGALVLRSK
jgi:hypothetical protein